MYRVSRAVTVFSVEIMKQAAAAQGNIAPFIGRAGPAQVDIARHSVIYAEYIGQARDRTYLLMRKCTGRMACSGAYRKDWNVLCGLLANSLKMLWNVDVSDCPSDQRLCRKLAQAARNVETGLVPDIKLHRHTVNRDVTVFSAEIMKQAAAAQGNIAPFNSIIDL